MEVGRRCEDEMEMEFEPAGLELKPRQTSDVTLAGRAGRLRFGTRLITI
jgi:hypothetical protein